MTAARFPVWALIALAFGCQSVGLEPAQTFNDRLAVGYTSVTTVRQMTETLLVGGKIGVEEAQAAQVQADTGRAALDATRTLNLTDPTNAASRLDAILLGLRTLEATLRAKEAP